MKNISDTPNPDEMVGQYAENQRQLRLFIPPESEETVNYEIDSEPEIEGMLEQSYQYFHLYELLPKTENNIKTTLENFELQNEQDAAFSQLAFCWSAFKGVITVIFFLFALPIVQLLLSFIYFCLLLGGMFIISLFLFFALVKSLTWGKNHEDVPALLLWLLVSCCICIGLCQPLFAPKEDYFGPGPNNCYPSPRGAICD